jgi:hypothetical protein
MGYVKLEKDSKDEFDVLSAEGVATVKLGLSAKLGKISVSYIGDVSNEILIQPDGWIVGTTSTHFVQSDVQAIVKAIGLISGGAGMQNTSTLTKDVASATYASV